MVNNLVDLNLFGGAYKNTRVLVTGDTGFKGAWLVKWLEMMGADICGYAQDYISLPNHHKLLNLKYHTVIADVNDFDFLLKTIDEFKPQIIFHLAAQALVRQSYKQPLTTFQTNIMGTANILEASRLSNCVKAVVNITSDKCYQNNEWVWGYKETDAMGGFDPYSASKGCSELITSSYRNAFGSDEFLIASCRAGNVIGGGDWAEDRLIPDMIKALQSGKTTIIRSPQSTRPWQHVLEPLSGYLLVGQKLLASQKNFAEGWNFGPSSLSQISVAKISSMLKDLWNFKIEFKPDCDAPHEACLLKLDCAKANTFLHWYPIWDINKTLSATVQWYKTYMQENKILTAQQIADYVADARNLKMTWCCDEA